MSTFSRLLRTSLPRHPHLHTPWLTQPQIRCASAGSHQGTDWQGRPTEEHAADRKDELDVQAGASQAGKRARASGDDNQGQSATENDSGNQNHQAKKDHPEAPGPVIGMNDERGGMGHKK